MTSSAKSLEPVGVVGLGLLGTALAERSDDLQPCAAHNPHLLIPAVGHIDESFVRRKCEVVHRSRGARVLRNEELFLECAVLAEDLDAVVAAIADIHESVN